MRRTTDGRTDGRLLSKESTPTLENRKRERDRRYYYYYYAKVVCVIDASAAAVGIDDSDDADLDTRATKAGGKIGIGRRTDAPSRRVYARRKYLGYAGLRRKGGGARRTGRGRTQV